MEDPHEINAAKADMAFSVNIVIYLPVYINIFQNWMEELLTQAVLQWRASGARCISPSRARKTVGLLVIILISSHWAFHAWWDSIICRVVTRFANS